MAPSTRRTAIACTFCRQRKRRCDGRQPQCKACREKGLQCVYTETESQDEESPVAQSALLQRLSAIEALLSQHSASISALERRSETSPTSVSVLRTEPASATSNNESPLTSGDAISHIAPFLTGKTSESRYSSNQDENLPPITIPPKHRTSASHLLLLPQIARVAGDYPEDYFFGLENARPRTATADFLLEGSTNSLAEHPDIDKSSWDFYVDVFFDIVQPFHPFLNDHELKAQCEEVRSQGFGSDPKSALVMAVLALSSTVSAPVGVTPRQGDSSPMDVSRSTSPESSNADSPIGTTLMQRALRILFASWMVSFGGDVVMSQALLLCALYFTYTVDPLMAWRLVHMASTSIQQVLNRCQDFSSKDKQVEILTRLSWVCFILESDILAEFNQPRSGIELLVDKLPFPNYGGPACPSHLYVLAEISARLLLNRIHHSLFFTDNLTIYTGGNPSASDQGQSSILHPDASLVRVCSELDHQLETWYNSLPEIIKPNLEGSPSGDKLSSLLRLRYWSAKQVIFRAFVIHVTSIDDEVADQIPPSVLEMCQVCLNASRLFITTAEYILSHRTPYTYSVAQCCLTNSLTLSIAACSDVLLKFIGNDIFNLLHQTTKLLEPWSEDCPSIRSAFQMLQLVELRLSQYY
ncbi:Zn(2)-C6 fungal-type domain-containing protein [Fusarium sp. LHS14.1]|nr:Zn(2)-C6 fungal-type domain-containing protein [Fusarium sp. LHS14.1]